MTTLPFQAILDALADLSTAFPPRHSSRFSDLSPSEVAAFNAVWSELPRARKHSFLNGLLEQHAKDTRVSFDAVAMALMPDTDPQVRIFALRLLSESDALPSLRIALAALKGDPRDEVRQQAAQNLGMFVLWGEVEAIASSLSEQAEEALLTVTASPKTSAELHLAAMEALAYSSRPEVETLIENAYAHKDPRWVASSLRAMGRSADPVWQEQVIPALVSDDHEIRLAAIHAAGDLELKNAQPFLLEVLEDEEDEETYRAAIWSLSLVGDEDARLYIENLLDQAEQSDLPELAEFLEEALENLTFEEDLDHLNLLNLNPDDFEPKAK